MERKEITRLLRNCTKNFMLEGGTQLHAASVKHGLESDVVVCNDLVDMYGKCKRIDIGYQVFERMPERNVVSWTVLISGHLQQGNPDGSLKAFFQMNRTETRPNEFTLSTILKACGLLAVVENGLQTHGFCIKTGFEWYPVVSNSIVYMYSRSGKIDEARKMFDMMPFRNLVAWNAIIAGYAVGGKGRNALFLFQKMQEQGEVPDEFSFASVLKACSGIGAIREGTQAHASLIGRGLFAPPNAVLSGALIDLYVKCSHLSDARKMFDSTAEKNAIMWTTLIVGYAGEGVLMESLDLFIHAWKSGVIIDSFILSSIISVFADFSLIGPGKQVHSYIVKVPFGLDLSVSHSLIDMYLKCGLVKEAKLRFKEMPIRNVISWTVMINGLGKHGNGQDVRVLFNEMQQEGIHPDEVTHLAILSAFSHAGLVQESWVYFSRLKQECPSKLKVEHYSCMVDLLGRFGKLKEAKVFIENMPVEANAGIWQTLLSACRTHRDVKMGREIGEILLKLDGDNSVNYVMLSNIYAEAGMWEECENLREIMKRKGLKKQGGCSWIEVDKQVHFFYGGDDSHPNLKKIQEVLKEVEMRIRKEIGYSFKVRFSMHDVDEESKEDNLRMHSEKLAIGLGLLSSGLESGDVIRVYKNLRVCGDCHEFIKGISKVLRRVLVVRDANRFHTFENGVCSCGDYW